MKDNHLARDLLTYTMTESPTSSYRFFIIYASDFPKRYSLKLIELGFEIFPKRNIVCQPSSLTNHLCKQSMFLVLIRQFINEGNIHLHFIQSLTSSIQF